jgi:hypothetical protein
VTEPGSGLVSHQTSSGVVMELDEPDEFAARITGRSGSKYSWVGLKALTAGGWEDMTRPSGSFTIDWAEEINDQVADTPQVVWLRREPHTHRLTFEKDTCS